jgi:NAD(P)-dependent dehydrogenase (short-subunit alcohol dehydrogenase family)
MSPRIVLIFGAGPNIGQSVAKAFKTKGYKVALASRSLKAESSTSEELHIPTDCSNTDAITDAFNKVESTWGVPHVVVYNGPYPCASLDSKKNCVTNNKKHVPIPLPT